MFQYLRSVWIWAASAVLVVIWLPLMGIVWIFDKEPRLGTGRWFRRLGRMLTRIGAWHITITGREHIDTNQVYVIVSNHQSLADIPLLSHLRLDTKWLAKAELFRVPLFGWMLRMAGDVPVDRAAPRQGARALMQCAKYLRQKCSVVFFPEGGRSPDGDVQPFNEGAFALAIREQVPILPVVVEGTGKALPSQTWVWGKSRDIQLRVLEAIPVEGRGVRESAALRDAVRQKIVDELNRLRQPGQESPRLRSECLWGRSQPAPHGSASKKAESSGFRHRAKRTPICWRSAGTSDPIAVLLASGADRVRQLLPVKYARMRVSPFAFFRGSAILMAADLARLPNSGLHVQLCGDAHVQNLGSFAGPDGRLIFDINDFDESIRGPWEWDLKRMAASIVLAGRESGHDTEGCEAAATAFVSALLRHNPRVFGTTDFGSCAAPGASQRSRGTDPCGAAAIAARAPARSAEEVYGTERSRHAAIS